MNLELFLAKKFHFSEDKNNSKNLVSKPAVNIAVAGLAIGLAVMIVAMAVITGFKSEISSKISGFGSHVQITDYNNNDTYETNPVRFSPDIEAEVREIPGVKSVSKFCTKPAILKTDSDFKGVVLKGIDSGYDWDFFSSSLTEGSLPHILPDTLSNEVLISKKTASELRLGVGDKILAYFINDNVRVRRFTISGIYDTGLQQFDNLFIISDLRHIQSLNAWQPDQYSGMEISIYDFNDLDYVSNAVFMIAANRFEEGEESYMVKDIKSMNRAFFAWLDLLDVNVVVILILMLIVVSFNIISCLLILILDKTAIIGILKALGSRDSSIRKTILYQAAFLIGKGLFWGNIVGIGLCLVQYFFHVIPLDPEIYFVSYVPVEIKLTHILLMNVIAAVCSMAVLVIPSHIVSRISPATTMRFE